MPTILVAAFYRFVALPQYADMRGSLAECCKDNEVKGTILLAPEGINGTIAGEPDGVRAVLAKLRQETALESLTHKESHASFVPFHRLKIRLKREIVPLGVAGVDPAETTGHFVEPRDWNELISREDVTVIDVRNEYETEIGTFQSAVRPPVETFRDLAEWARVRLDAQRQPKIATFCTGGIRCEKLSSYIRSLGFEDVYQLKGGILDYLEQVPEERSLWRGECFVFDQRVSVGHGVQPGKHASCHACGRPLSDDDKTSPHYELGVSCARCHEEYSEEQKRGFASRQKQVELAEKRGDSHMGPPSQ